MAAKVVPMASFARVSKLVWTEGELEELAHVQSLLINAGIHEERRMERSSDGIAVHYMGRSLGGRAMSLVFVRKSPLYHGGIRLECGLLVPSAFNYQHRVEPLNGVSFAYENVKRWLEREAQFCQRVRPARGPDDGPKFRW